MKSRKDKRGVAIGVVLMLAIVGGIILFALVARMIGHTSRVRRSVNVRAATYLAEAGLAHCIGNYVRNLRKGGTNRVAGELLSGKYEAVAYAEAKQGAAGQRVVQILAQGRSKDGSIAGCLQTFELFMAPDGKTVNVLIPTRYNRFRRPVDFGNKTKIEELLYGDEAIRRKERLTRAYANLTREMAMPVATYRKKLEGMAGVLPPCALRADWKAVVDGLTQAKVTRP